MLLVKGFSLVDVSVSGCTSRQIISIYEGTNWCSGVDPLWKMVPYLVVDVCDFFYIHAHSPYGLHKFVSLVLRTKIFLSHFPKWTNPQISKHVISAFSVMVIAGSWMYFSCAQLNLWPAGFLTSVWSWFSFQTIYLRLTVQ